MDWSRLFTVDEPGLYGKTMPGKRSISKEETLRPGLREERVDSLCCLVAMLPVIGT